MRFIAFHGVHEEEKVLGNEFEVNITVLFEAQGRVTQLEDTVNYASIFNVAKQRMQVPSGLLETVAQDILQGIQALDSRIEKITVSIDKLNTPIQELQGRAGVTVEW